MARNKDDPFYIAPSGGSSPTAFYDMIAKSNGGDELDVDSIPIIDLQIDHSETASASLQSDPEQHRQRGTTRKKKPAKKFVIAADETLDGSDDTTGTGTGTGSQHGKSASLSTSATPHRHRSMSPLPRTRPQTQPRPGRSLLTFDSSTLGQISLEAGSAGHADSEAEILRREAEELEMTLALREVENKRLEMQRELERGRTVLGEGVDAEGTVVKRKKKKRAKIPEGGEMGGDAEVDRGEAVVVVKKKKKKRRVKPEEEVGGGGGGGRVPAGEMDKGEEFL